MSPALRQRLLLPSAQAPAGFTRRGAIVCTCFDVAEAEVRAELGAASDTASNALARLKQTLKCGTNCGSCLPELRRLVAETADGATRATASA
jgi:assimilatory nitrate reductase catalytic subunit